MPALVSIEQEQDRRKQVVARDLGNFIHNVESVKEDASRVLELVSRATPEQIEALFQTAEDMGAVAWQIKAACCHVMLKRAKAAKEAGEPLDMEAEDIGDLVGAVAKSLCCATRDVYQSAKLYKAFLAPGVAEEIAGTRNLLKERTYFDEALRSDDPGYAIVEMAREKTKNAHFNTGKARSFVEKLNTEVIETEIVLPPELQQKIYEDTQEKLAHIIEVISTDFLKDVPTPALERRVKRWLKEAKLEKRRSPERENRRVLAAIRADCNDLDDIETATYLNRLDLVVILARLEAAGLIDKEKKVKMGRGDRQWFYTLKGETRGSAFQVQHSPSNPYAPRT